VSTAPSTAFTVRRLAVVTAAGLSWTLVVISMLFDPAPSADGRDLVAAYARDSAAAGIHTNLIHYGFALLAPAVYGMVGLVRGRGAWLANLAALLAVVGLSTLPGLVMLDLATTAAVQVSDVDTALAASAQLDSMPAFVAIVAVAFPAAVLAVPVAVAALWRAGLVHGSVAGAGVVAALAPNIAPTWWLGFGIQAAFMLMLAALLWRLPLAAWTGGTEAGWPVRDHEPAAAH
jgi:hypothetical protein